MSYGPPLGDSVAFSFSGATYFAPAGDGANFSFVPLAPVTPTATASAQVVLACSASGVRGVFAAVSSQAVRGSSAAAHGVSASAAVQVGPRIGASVVGETLVPSVVAASVVLACTATGSAWPYGRVARSVSITGSVKGDFADSLAVVQSKIAITAAAVGAVPPGGNVASRIALSCAAMGHRGAMTTGAGAVACRGDVRGWHGPVASAHCTVRLDAAAQSRAGNAGVLMGWIQIKGSTSCQHFAPASAVVACQVGITGVSYAEIVQKGRDTDAMFVLTAAEQLGVWTDV